MQKKSFIVIMMSVWLLTTAGGVAATEQLGRLRMALLPIPDVLPIYVAEEKGFFKDLGLVVESLPVGSALERDQLLQAGRIDGMINELSGAANFNRNKNVVKVVSVARAPLGNSPLFRIVSAPGSGIDSPEKLAGVAIGISKNTVIEYISARLLTASGVEPDAISFQSVPVLPERLQLLLSGQIKAATLPDPLGAAALKAGAIEVVNDLALKDVSASVITFSNESLTGKKEAVKAFMTAWDMAAAELNANPEAYRQLMLGKIRVPRNIRDQFSVPPMVRRALPSRKQWQDVMDWMVSKGLLERPLAYESSVTADFVAD
ncbi:ABC transporter substrate-binding protein [Desulforhopalus singaporensis]|uniref:NitT/TauT family transport system substrate-binding protein n=1 Tax=Desulforhopalus singaporensis TaxID=91360 RepID=A0A1H0KQ04_9BACT|nr:ABC transporter substrate-binding protein [Desulforhopalus singaporensis]SDO58057.1 NitT/TauT family transport system substrate-binding protein [Desulforhopalus singaporensis]